MSASLASSLARLSLRTAQRAPRSSLLACAVAAPLVGGSCSSVRYATSSSGPIAIGNLKPNIPKKTIKRLGRGPGSGRGGTSTRGHKGQKARAGNGKPVPGFEGGQTPIMRRYPKRGFVNAHAQEYAVVNVDRIQHWIDRGLLDPSQPITARELHESNCVHGVKDGIKLLGEGAQHLRTPINLIVSRATGSAIAAVEAAGGTIETKYYTEMTLRALVKPYKFEGRLLPRDADPSSKRELIYYSNPAHRGYLAARPTPAPLERKPSAASVYLARVKARAQAAKGVVETVEAAALDSSAVAKEEGAGASGTPLP